MKNITFLFFTIVLLYTNQLFCQNNIVAKIDDKIITAEEFRQRFEYSTMMYNTNDIEKRKEIFLLSLIADEILAKNTNESIITQNPVLKYSMNYIEEMFLRDKLYKTKILDKIKISGAELLEATKRYTTSLDAFMLSSKSESVLSEAYKFLSEGVSIDSLLKLPIGYNIAVNNIQIASGEIQKPYEDILYHLPQGTFSKPVKSDMGYTIFHVKRIYVNSERAGKSPSEIQHGAEEIIQKQKEYVLYTQLNKDIIGGKVVNVDGKLFHKLADLIWEKEYIKDEEGNYAISLSFDNIYGLKDKFTSGELNSPYLKFQNNPVKLKDFLGMEAYLGIDTKVKNIDELKKFLSARNRTAIRFKLYAREAKRLGYDKSPEVVKDINMWKNSYMAAYKINMLKDSVEVSEREVLDYQLEKDSRGLATNLYTYTFYKTKSLDRINMMLSLISDGKEFIAAMNGVATREDTIRRQKNVQHHLLPEAHKVLYDINTKEVYGPIEEDNCYTLLYLEEKVEKKMDNLKNESNLEGLKSELYSHKLEDFINSKTAKYAEDTNLEVNLEALKDIKVSNINIVVMRSFGFGEKILASPILNAQVKWYYEYLKNKEEI